MDGIDARLLDRCKRSDQKALRDLYESLYSLMKSICIRYVFDHTEVQSVMNTAFLKIVNGLDKYDSSRPFKPWASVITVNTSLDFVRKKMRERDQERSYEEAHQLPAYDWNIADQNLDAESLMAMMDALPPKTRTIFNLFAIDGFSHEEIAQKFEISTGTSKWHVSTARETLRQMVMDSIERNKAV